MPSCFFEWGGGGCVALGRSTFQLKKFSSFVSCHTRKIYLFGLKFAPASYTPVFNILPPLHSASFLHPCFHYFALPPPPPPPPPHIQRASYTPVFIILPSPYIQRASYTPVFIILPPLPYIQRASYTPVFDSLLISHT